MHTVSWADGYVTEIEYEYYYFGDLAPSLMDYVCLQMGHRPPVVGGEYHYCELGCGLGLSSLALAAANPRGRFVAVDLNPNHVVTARRLADEAGIDNVEFIEGSFEDLGDRDLPPFDYVGLHGVWSWVSPEARNAILTFVEDRLATGGVVYLSYNDAVGWERRRTLRHLFKELVERAPGTLQQQIEHAMFVIGELVEEGNGYFKDNEVAKGWLEATRKASPRYLAHEYLNEHWQPYYHAEVAGQLRDARLGFVGSTDVLRNFDRYVLIGKAAELAERLADPWISETFKDLVSNWGLRRDVYKRGSASWSQDEAFQLFASQRICLTRERKAVTPDVKTPIGDSSIDPKLMDPIADALDEGIQSLGDLANRVPDFNFFDVLVVCSILIQNGSAVPLPLGEPQDAREACERLNDAIDRRTLHGESIPILVSPVSASGIGASDLERLGHHALKHDPDLDADGLAARIRSAMERIGRVPMHDGKPSEDEDFAAFVQEILTVKAPLWRRLGVL